MSAPRLPGVLTVPEAAELASVSPGTIRNQIRLGNLRARYIGRCVRVLDEDLAAWLRAETSASENESKSRTDRDFPLKVSEDLHRAVLRSCSVHRRRPDGPRRRQHALVEQLRDEIADLRGQILCIRCTTPPPPPERWPGDPWSRDTRPSHTLAGRREVFDRANP